MDVRRGDGFWTIAEHGSHLAQVQAMLMERIDRFVAEERPEFIPYLPDKHDGPAASDIMTISEALEPFAAYRTRQLAVLAEAGDNIWQRQGRHPEYDHYALYILTRHILMHDHWHMYRIEEL